MATIQLRTDDITGETLPEDTPTTRLYIEDPRGDVSIEIDLSDASFKALQKAVDKIVSKGRPITGSKLPNDGKAAVEATRARAWAIAHRPDLKVKEKGAVPKAAIVAYREHLAGLDENGNPTEDYVNGK
jgi:hypothetical protein